METNVLSRLMFTLLIGLSASLSAVAQEAKEPASARPRVIGIPRIDRGSQTAVRTVSPASPLRWVKEFEPTSSEKKLLMVDAEDEARFAQFLAQPDTGIVRLLPYKEGRVVSGAEPEAYRRPGFIYFAATYSFSKRKHGHGLKGWHQFPNQGMAELRFTDDTLNTGFMEESVGLMVRIGDVPLELVTLQTEGVRQLADLLPPADYSTAVAQSERNRRGVEVKGFKYSAILPADLNTTYVLRSTLNRRADVLVCFRVVRRDTDGGINVLWKKLKNYPKSSWTRKRQS